jgi:hypothetical protein
MKTTITALVFCALAGGAQAEACLQDGQQIRGEVRYVETRHPLNGEPIKGVLLVLSKAVCIASDSATSGRWVEIRFDDERQFSRLQPGDDATITAKYEHPGTANHIGDIMAFDAQIVSVRRQK